ncbi:MAG: Asp-tRNA(Asn)/Glu-tRNA(Gln) amidotransferase subunit GatB [Thermoanaerobaculia bacterium]|nr:Asp-tRNA(Asn)/Glu-tRNA(Gln) amidotransferase subunit GatB [Thermoanaerobaculia bacterium]
MPGWEAIIGLEVHARLLTRTKLFCACETAFGAPANTRVCPVCLGYPGALPVLNEAAVELAAGVALATGCAVHQESVFARKNYFYPDLPKGYQISQFDRPLATGGYLDITTREGARRVRIHRIHIEEDAGKLIHDATGGASQDTSLVDLNRAGTPLIEIVSDPDLRSSEEALAYLTRLRQVVMYCDACDGNMEEGSLRCDANVSVRRDGEPLGTRSEVKNLNSFRFLAKAVDFEIERQIALLETGGTVVQETRLFDPATGETRAMRSKEEAHDYRYLPEPDLPPLVVSAAALDRVKARLPEMPAPRAERYRRDYGLSLEDSETLVATRELAEYFERTLAAAASPRAAANWVRNEVVGLCNQKKTPLSSFLVTPGMLGELIRMIDSGEISGKAAKDAFEEMADSGEAPHAIVERRGLSQLSDPEAIREIVERVVASNDAQVALYRAGKTGLFGHFVGQVMKASRGRANPEIANRLLREILDRDGS